MVTQVRYPNIVIQEESIDTCDWSDLDNIKSENWEEVAKCNVKAHKKPATIKATDFNFNIPSESRINSIEIGINYSKKPAMDQIIIKPPNIKINDKFFKKAHVNAECFPMDRFIIFNEKEFELTSKDINDDDFNIIVEFPENISDNDGVINFDFIYVKIVYEVQVYTMSTSDTREGYPTLENPLLKRVGDEFKYNVYFRNSNGINTDKQQVKINIPEGLELVKYYFKSSNSGNENIKDLKAYENELDEENMIWYPSVRGKGLASLRLILKCTDEGLKRINAYNEYTGASKDFYVEVRPKGTESFVNKFEELDVKWASELDDDKDYQLLAEKIAIKIENVSMEFNMPQEKVDNLKEYCIKWVKRELKPSTDFEALKDISFEIHQGERVGIIGFNGAGKSTLLKVLAGVFKPTKGKVYIDGNVAPLLELGAGFDLNYSGRENVFLNGAILGYSKEFLESKYDEIVEFSELGDFMEIPIKNYSSGMNAKLGFAVATVVDPEILILDEILSVGDVKFQKKSADKLKSMMDSGTTVLLVSHSTSKIRELCTRAIWLDKGELIMDGDVDHVCDAYIEAAEKASEDERKDLEFG